MRLNRHSKKKEEKNNSLCRSREVKSGEFRFIMKFHDLNETVAAKKAAGLGLKKLIPGSLSTFSSLLPNEWT